ncbi:MAG: hypothetical protein WCV67_04505 [Victivallaceae bacterium]|jgi:tetratricopeptide (TPR) repeat protein
MYYSSDREIKLKAAAIIKPVAAAVSVTCRRHPSAAAAALCLQCGHGMCGTCFEAALPRMICSSCRSSLTPRKLLINALKSLRFPALWVMACVIASGIAYGMGMGNPSPAALAAKDISWPWFLQDLGKLYLAQGGRENQRAAALNYLQRPAEAEKWYRQAAASFRKTAEYWKKTPVYYDLVIGEARALSGSGNNQGAIDLLLPLKIPPGDQAYAACQYYLGILYEKNGNKPDAVECFRRSLNAANAVAGRQMDSLITMLTGDRREARMIISVKMMCETNLSYAELQELLKKYNLVQEEQSSYRWKRAAVAKEDESIVPRKEAKPAADDDFKVEILKKVISK